MQYVSSSHCHLITWFPHRSAWVNCQQCLWYALNCFLYPPCDTESSITYTTLLRGNAQTASCVIYPMPTDDLRFGKYVNVDWESDCATRQLPVIRSLFATSLVQRQYVRAPNKGAALAGNEFCTFSAQIRSTRVFCSLRLYVTFSQFLLLFSSPWLWRSEFAMIKLRVKISLRVAVFNWKLDWRS